jgi:hypothetical protein
MRDRLVAPPREFAAAVTGETRVALTEPGAVVDL